ncbi:MAG: hypothetical protein AB2A00_05735 [Myxococcota bacterium]
MSEPGVAFFGLDRAALARLREGREVQFEVSPVLDGTLLGALSYAQKTLTCIVLYVRAPEGTGLSVFRALEFESASLARTLGGTSLRYIALAVINDALGRILPKKGFESTETPIPDVLGDKGNEAAFVKTVSVGKEGAK